MTRNQHNNDEASLGSDRKTRLVVSSHLGIFWQVRTWIIGGLILALAPIGIYDYWQLQSEEALAIQRAKVQLHETASTVQNKVDELIDDAEELLLALSQVPSIRGNDTGLCNDTLRNISRQYVKYTNFSVVNEEKFIVCSSGKLTKPVNVNKSPNIREAFDTGKFAISPFKLGVLTGKPILVFSAPIIDGSNEVIGTVNNGLDLSWLSGFIAELDIPLDASITVFSTDGRVIAHHPGGTPATGDKISDQPLLEAFLNNSKSFTLADGREALFSVSSLTHVPGGIHIAAYRPSAPLHDAVKQELFRRLLVLLAILVGTASLVLLGAQALLIQPLQRLRNTADNLAAGNMSVRTGIQGGFGEVGHVATCFDQMADSLEQREASLKKTVENLGHSNAELERFAFVASHDLQEPLRTVISFTQMLERKLGDRMDDELKEYMDYVTGGALRMRSLVGDLLDYSRVSSRVAPMIQVDMVEISKTVLENLQDSIQESGAIITVADDLPLVCGDALQLGLALQNLISNAIKYRHTGRTPEISVTSNREDGHNLFKVADNGIGIDPQFHDQIFEAFKRLHGPEVYQGTGIGLAIVKRIIERHRGEIWLQSTLDGGTTFCFTLPYISSDGCGSAEEDTSET